MIDSFPIVTHSIIETLGWSLLHFLWQGALIATITAIILSALKNVSASLRYLVACIAFAAMSAAPPITTWLLMSDAGALTLSMVESPSGRSDGQTGSLVTRDVLVAESNVLSSKPSEGTITTPPSVEAVGRQPTDSRSWLTMMVVAWLGGVTLLSLRLLSKLVRIARLRKFATTSPPSRLVERVSELRRRLNVSRPVKLVQSTLVEVPTVIGVVQPVILLPLSAMTGLSADQLDGILAHELAHIRRHDYFINLVQAVIETLLFYHPAVWWLSSRIRQERENCCDDIASAACQNPIRYAEALIRMEELRTPSGSLSLAVKGGNLTRRIRRLLGQPPLTNRSTWWLGGLVSLLIVVAMLTCVASIPTEMVAQEVAAPTQREPEESRSNKQLGTAKHVDDLALTPSDIADRMEAAMSEYATVDFSGELVDGAFGPDLPGAPTRLGASFRYRADKERYFAEQRWRGRSKGRKDWLEGFDGSVHFHKEDSLLFLGEESLTGQTLSAKNLLFSFVQTPLDTLQALRNDKATVVATTDIDGTDCLVVEIPRQRGERTWAYRITVAPERSWLPVAAQHIVNGEIRIQHTLEQLEPADGVWFPRQITKNHLERSVVVQSRQIQIKQFSATPIFRDTDFAPPISLGTNVMDRRVGWGWREDPWWHEIKPWLQREIGWPRAELFEMRSMQHYGECLLEGKPAPPLELAEWLTTKPGGWDRPERKLTLLYFYGGRLITPTPQWAGALKELHGRYKKYGFEVIGVATASKTPELTRQAAQEMLLGFSVGIDQESNRGYGKTFAAFGLDSYHGMFFIDHKRLVWPCSQGNTSQVRVNGHDFTISHMESTVIRMLKEAGVDNVESQVLIADPFDLDSCKQIVTELRRLRAEATKGAAVQGWVAFNAAAVAGATINLTPSMTIMSSNTGHGFTQLPDYAATLTVTTDSEGRYAVTGLTKGEYTFTCVADGFESVDRTVLIGADLPQVNVDVALSKK